MTLDLRKDEMVLIQKLRVAPKFSTLQVEKRPSNEFPDGEVQRIVVETSYLVREVVVKLQ